MKKTAIFLFSVIISLSVIGCHQPVDVEQSVSDVPENVETDAELEQLMAMIVPYEPSGQYVLDEEKRFLHQLDLLINQDLADQSDEYKLAVRKLALRHALAMNRVVDSIEVRRNGLYSPKTGYYWSMGGTIDRHIWDQSPNHGDATTNLFTVVDGKIADVNLNTIVDACGGKFSDCCASAILYPYLDDAWLKDFVDLEMAKCFPFSNSKITGVGLQYLADRKASNPVTRLCLTGTSLTSRELKPLAELNAIEMFILITESHEINAAIFERLPNFPNLKNLELSPGKVSKSQMENLAKCRQLQNLKLSHFLPESPDVFEPINQLKELEDLSISSGKKLDRSFWHVTSAVPGTQPPFNCSGETIVLSDLPKLTQLSLHGFQNNSVKLDHLPSIKILIVEADLMEGDILSEKTPSLGVEILFVPGGKLTESQTQALAKRTRLLHLGLHNLHPENPNIFTSLKEIKKLEHLALQFAPGAAESYGDAVLTIDVPKLQYLQVDFQEKNDVRLDLPMENLNSFRMKFLSHINELPKNIGNIIFENANMSYDQFQVFKNGGRGVVDHYRFTQLILTDIDTDHLFEGWKFIYHYTIAFDPVMQETLKGKTLHFENCDQLSELSLQVPEPEEINIKLSNLPRMRICEIKPICPKNQINVF